MGQLEQEKDAGYLFLDIDSKRQKKTGNYEKVLYTPLPSLPQ